MTKRIVINHPGAGERIMAKMGAHFNPECEHSIATYDGDRFLGGFVINHYLGNSVAIHDGSDDPRWCSRDLLWMLFHYVFVQLGCHRAYGPVASDNYHALEVNLRGGWRLEYVLKDAMAPGRHCMLLSMEPGTCRWLRIKPQGYVPGNGRRPVSDG